MSSHALVVGGTNMLAGLTHHVAAKYDHVTAIARRPEVLGHIPQVRPLALDYHDDAALVAGLRQHIHTYGPIDLAVAWIHSTAPDARRLVAETLAEAGRPFRLFLVLSSRFAAPGRRPGPVFEPVPELCGYREVLLGWMDQGARWLTHAEISHGTIHAVEADLPQHIIGQVRPWTDRP